TLKQVRGADAGTAQDIPFLGRYLPAEDDTMDDEGSTADAPTDETTDTETGHRVTKKAPTTSGKATKNSRRPSLDTPIPGSRKKKQLDGGGKDDGSGDGEGESGGGGGTTGQPPGDRPGKLLPNNVRFRSLATDDGYEI